jgi:hypothetical protein
VPYLDSNATEPGRYARATIVFGGENLYRQEYMVGPLPATNSTEVKPLTAPFNNQQLGKTFVHPVYSPEDGAQFQAKVGSDIEDITKKLWNTVSDFISYAVHVFSLPCLPCLIDEGVVSSCTYFEAFSMFPCSFVYLIS